MIIYVLIIVANAHSGYTVHTTQFQNMEACETIGRAIVQVKNTRLIDWKCVEVNNRIIPTH